MTLSVELVEQVRRRAAFACEYCGVTEIDAGGPLTVDHYRPQAQGGTDELDNLLYCCYRCNLYKADYWPRLPSDPALWHPRQEPLRTHLLILADGTLYPITATGTFTIRRLRLNRPPLVAHRVRRQMQADEVRLLTRYREVVALLEQMHRQQAALLEEHRALLEEQRALLRGLLQARE
jgi:hypothetical protein